MIEININQQFKDSIDGNPSAMNFCASVAEIGSSAGEITWSNAKNAPYSYINDDNKEIVLNYFLGFGCWEKEEIIEDLNALLVQEISHQIRDFEGCESNWDEYEKDSESGQVKGDLFRNGKDYYIFIGN